MASSTPNTNLILRTQKEEAITFEEMDYNLTYLNGLLASKGIQGPNGLNGLVGITFSENDPVNPDNNPENKVWFKVDTDGITILKIYTWDEVNCWNLNVSPRG